MKKLINLNQKLKNFKGQEENILLSEIVAELISTEMKGNALKLFGWMQELVKSGQLELDESDFLIFKKLIEETDRTSILVKGQILSIIF